MCDGVQFGFFPSSGQPRSGYIRMQPSAVKPFIVNTTKLVSIIFYWIFEQAMVAKLKKMNVSQTLANIFVASYSYTGFGKCNSQRKRSSIGLWIIFPH